MRDLTAPVAARPHVTDGSAPLAPGLRGAVMLLGSFDGMHLGHRALLAAGRAEAQARGAPLAILQCDPHPRAFFGGSSRFRISPGTAQAHLLAKAGIDLIYAPRFDAAFAAMRAEAFIADCLIARLGVSAVVTGRDFRFGAGRGGDAVLLAHHLPLIRVEDRCAFGQRVSSSAVRAAIVAGEIARAIALLGHPWLTTLQPAGDVWHFAPDQILPPPGDWPVIARDADGTTLARARIRLSPDGIARGPLPPATALLDWQTLPGDPR